MIVDWSASLLSAQKVSSAMLTDLQYQNYYIVKSSSHKYMQNTAFTDEVRVQTIEHITEEVTKPVIIGNYELGKTIGRGTFGKVKQAIHIPTKEKVAIKIIDKNTIQQEQDTIRIKREVEIMKKVRHPNIAYLYQIIETTQFIYLVIEYAEQGQLFRVMTNEVRLKQRAAGRIFYQVLNAVEYLHRLHIAHRDLKPENILLDVDFNIKLIDFGLSNYSESDKKLKTACGSPCYAPPEMVAGNEYNGIIGDIWSLGIIFYGMVCGSLPFEEKTTKELYKKVIEGFYVLPSDISVQAIEVIQKMLITDPLKRITIPQLRKLKFFRQIKTIEPQLIGIIVGFHAMPIDNEILQKMKEYTEYHHYSNKQVQIALKQNEHNNLTTMYYLLQKKTLKQGGKTIVDLQAYLESNEKYKSEYGKETLKKYELKIKQLRPPQTARPSHYSKVSREKDIQKSHQKYQYHSAQKSQRKNYSVSIDKQKKVNLSVKRRLPTEIKTQRSTSIEERSSLKVNSKNKNINSNSNTSPLKTNQKKYAIDLWQTYFKHPLNDVTKEKQIRRKNTKDNDKSNLMNMNIRKLKQGFCRLPNMIKKNKLKDKSPMK